MRANLMVLSVAAALLPTIGAEAAEVTIVSDRDNTLIEEGGGALSNGAGERMFAGRTSFFGSRRAVMHFDVSSIPAGSTVTAASVSLNLSLTITGNTSQSLHRLLADWGEGTSDPRKEEGAGAPATRGDATWVHTFHPDQMWDTAGGDFISEPSATRTVGAVFGFYTWTGDRLTADVQNWVNGSANYGWILIGDETQPTTTKRYDTRENSNPDVRPRLVVTYAPPCPADLNGSGTVNGLDLAIVLGAWTGPAFYTGCPPHLAQDINQDCKVNGLDLAIVLGAWGPCPR